MAVGMLAIDQTEEGTVRDGRRHISKLRQPVQTQLPHAHHVAIFHRWSCDNVSEQRERAVGKARQDREAGDDAVRSDIGLDLGAKARDRLMYLDRRSVAASLVEHIGRHRGQPVFSNRVAGGAAPNQQGKGDDRHLRMANGPHRQTVGQRGLLDRGKSDGDRRRRFRQPRPIDLDEMIGVHETTAGTDSGAASSVRPRGTTLSVTRRAGSKYRRTASCNDPVVTE